MRPTGQHALRQLDIAELEGHAVAEACEDLGHRWGGCAVPLGIDNMVFYRCLVKQRSPNERLNNILKRIHAMAVQYDFVLVPTWIPSAANKHADLLSRRRWATFAVCVQEEVPATLTLPRQPVLTCKHGCTHGAAERS